jgi:hypothetical protein
VRWIQHETAIVNKTILFECTRTEATLLNDQLWPNVASPQSYTCVWNTMKFCTFAIVSVLVGIHLVAHTCEYNAIC